MSRFFNCCTRGLIQCTSHCRVICLRGSKDKTRANKTFAFLWIYFRFRIPGFPIFNPRFPVDSDLGFASMIITRIFRSGILCNIFEFERSNTDCKNHQLLVNLRSFKSTVCNSSLSLSSNPHKRWFDSVPSLKFQTCYQALNLSLNSSL